MITFKVRKADNFGTLKGFLEVALGVATDPTPAVGSVDVAKGDLIFVGIGQQTSILTSGVTDNLGNTYTAQNAGTDSGNNTGVAYYSIATVAGTLTTVNVANQAINQDIVVIAAVIAGPFGAIDANPANGTDATSPITCPATGVLSSPKSVVMAWVQSNGNQGYAATAPNLLVRTLASSTVQELAVGYQLVNATTSVSPEFTRGVNPGNCSQGTASFTKA